jgi:arsenate reductase
MPSVTIYGIKNCDTMKKARAWLDAHGVEYRFHDFRKDGLTAKQLDAWLKELGWETLLNRRGQLWRKLDEKVRDNINAAAARQLMLDNPAIIKRPLLDLGRQRHVGFKPEDYAHLFN